MKYSGRKCLSINCTEKSLENQNRWNDKCRTLNVTMLDVKNEKTCAFSYMKVCAVMYCANCKQPKHYQMAPFDPMWLLLGSVVLLLIVLFNWLRRRFTPLPELEKKAVLITGR
jgi:hypothetical protein